MKYFTLLVTVWPRSLQLIDYHPAILVIFYKDIQGSKKTDYIAYIFEMR